MEDILVALKAESDDAINRVLEILQNRIDQFGVSEPTIQKQGKHRIAVELAGIKDSERARALLQSTALLEFYLVKNNSITSELISQLDEALKDEKTIKSETSKPNIAGEKDKNNDTEKTKQVSELFSQEKPIEEDSLNSDG